MTPSAFARKHGVNVSLVYRWIREKRIKFQVSKSENGRASYWVTSKDRPERKPEGNHSKKEPKQ